MDGKKRRKERKKGRRKGFLCGKLFYLLATMSKLIAKKDHKEKDQAPCCLAKAIYYPFSLISC
jgi:hypothetical protein